MWFGVTTMLGALSGWYALMNRYPDRPESPMLVLRHQSGSFGFVGMSRILVLSACPSGLRIGMMRIFGPFCRDFFVPWDEIRVRRKDRVLWRTAILEFAQQPTQAVDTGPDCQSTGTFGCGQMARARTLSGGDGRRGRVEDRKAVARNHELGGGILHHCSANCRPGGRRPTDRHRCAIPRDRLRNWCADPIPSSTGLVSLRISVG